VAKESRFKVSHMSKKKSGFQNILETSAKKNQFNHVGDERCFTLSWPQNNLYYVEIEKIFQNILKKIF
jgi:ribose 1,5-bisphosphokinase PhnN